MFPPCSLILRGMGYRDGGADVLAFRQACLRGRVTPTRSLLLRSAMSEARVAGDQAGNYKLSKKRQRVRDDACAASVLAVAHGSRTRALSSTWRYAGAV